MLPSECDKQGWFVIQSQGADQRAHWHEGAWGRETSLCGVPCPVNLSIQVYKGDGYRFCKACAFTLQRRVDRAIRQTKGLR